MSNPDWRAIAERELRNEATPEDVELLTANVETWYSQLVGILERVNLSLQRKAADLEVFRQECHAKSTPEAKREFFAAQAEHGKWRSRTLGFKTHVDAKMREVKQLRQQKRVEGHRDQGEAGKFLRAERDAARAALALVIEDYAHTSGLKVGELIEDLVDDHRDHEGELRLAQGPAEAIAEKGSVAP